MSEVAIKVDKIKARMQAIILSTGTTVTKKVPSKDVNSSVTLRTQQLNVPKQKVEKSLTKSEPTTSPIVTQPDLTTSSTATVNRDRSSPKPMLT